MTKIISLILLSSLLFSGFAQFDLSKINLAPLAQLASQVNAANAEQIASQAATPANVQAASQIASQYAPEAAQAAQQAAPLAANQANQQAALEAANKASPSAVQQATNAANQNSIPYVGISPKAFGQLANQAAASADPQVVKQASNQAASQVTPSNVNAAASQANNIPYIPISPNAFSQLANQAAGSVTPGNVATGLAGVGAAKTVVDQASPSQASETAQIVEAIQTLAPFVNQELATELFNEAVPVVIESSSLPSVQSVLESFDPEVLALLNNNQNLLEQTINSINEALVTAYENLESEGFFGEESVEINLDVQALTSAVNNAEV